MVMTRKEEGEEELEEEEDENDYDESGSSEFEEEEEGEKEKDLVEMPANTLSGTATPFVPGSELHVTRGALLDEWAGTGAVRKAWEEAVRLEGSLVIDANGENLKEINKKDDEKPNHQNIEDATDSEE